MTANLPNLDVVGGFLGQVCRERLADYAATVASEPRPGSALGRFQRALEGDGDGLRLVAEVKRSSPLGSIAELDAVRTARAYAAGGASALSVLTEPRHFRGSVEDLRAVAAGQSLPALLKDFVVHPAMIEEAAEAGAAAVLLIVAALGDETASFLRLAHAWGLDALVEVHTEAELELAVGVGSRMIGVNNRDLGTLEINLGTAPRLGQLARQDDFEGVLVALSGYSDAAGLRSLEGLYDAVLVGSSLAGAADPTAAVRALLGRA